MLRMQRELNTCYATGSRSTARFERVGFDCSSRKTRRFHESVLFNSVYYILSLAWYCIKLPFSC